MAVLGIELGSTRIKAVLIDTKGNILAAGAYDWENRLEDGVWTYRLDDVWAGIADVVAQVKKTAPTGENVEAIGISAMMHGYLVFDSGGSQLAPFRTWRNTFTEAAAAELSEAFSFNIPQRWSAAHLYQAMLNGEEHVHDIAFITTLAGYVHWMLTGEKCLGIGDASGMFPISGADYDAAMLSKFEQLAAQKGYDLRLSDILPRALSAGEDAGGLTEKGASLLDSSGWLKCGTPLCPPEGDAGTGMVATNSIAPLTGNVSAGTSIFAMVVLEEPLADIYPEIDMVTTPTGSPVAMVHCNNCTSDLDAWFGLFGEFLKMAGAEMKKEALYDLLYESALDAQPDAGGLLSYNYYSGEPITKTDAGVPLFVRRPDSKLSLSNFCRSLLFSSVATLKLGMDILIGKENVKLSYLQGHGGLFKTKMVGQRILASALGVPVKISETAGEGGAWGAAVLAGYLVWHSDNEKLDSYLESRVFIGQQISCEEPSVSDAAGFERYLKTYIRGIPTERAAGNIF